MDGDNKLKAIRMRVQAASALIPQPTLRDDRVSGSNLDLRKQVVGGGGGGGEGLSRREDGQPSGD